MTTDGEVAAADFVFWQPSGIVGAGSPGDCANVIKQTQRLLWRLLALIFVGTGIVGIIVPGLPTVVFLLLAAWASSHGWPELEQRLLAHPEYGPVIRQWREEGKVPRRAKWLASAMMLFSATAMQFLPTPPMMRVLLPVFLLGVAVWLWRRPEPDRPLL